MARPEDAFPIGFKNKVRYFRATNRAVLSDPSLRASYADASQELLDRSQMRNRVIHGFLIELDPKGRAGVFGNFGPSSANGLPREHRYTSRKIRSETERVRSLASLLIALSRQLNDLR
jgi:hypothetical protein